MAKAKLKPVPTPAPLLKLDLGCGMRPREGFTGVDVKQINGKADIVFDLRKTPWPWGDGSVEEVHCSHFLEHLAGAERIPFFNELYRVLIPGGKATIIIPSWTSERAYGDPTHQWPPMTGFFFYYLDKGWRKDNAPHVDYTCDFEFIGGNSLGPPWTLRNAETQAFAQTHYLNVAQDIHTTLTKRV